MDASGSQAPILNHNQPFQQLCCSRHPSLVRREFRTYARNVGYSGIYFSATGVDIDQVSRPQVFSPMFHVKHSAPEICANQLFRLSFYSTLFARAYFSTISSTESKYASSAVIRSANAAPNKPSCCPARFHGARRFSSSGS